MNLVRQGRFLVGSFFASSGWIPLGVGGRGKEGWRDRWAFWLRSGIGSGLGRLLLAGIQLERSEGILDLGVRLVRAKSSMCGHGCWSYCVYVY
jgi:hypothetical protein